MRLVNAQRQLRERGRIRTGYSTRNAKGDKIPHRSETFIFSAPDEQTIREVAALFGGEPEPWDEGRDRWRVTTTEAEVAVVFVGHMGFSQEYVQYRKGFPVLRCDGAQCWTPGTRKRLDEQPCMCDPDNRSCQLTTHLQVILADLLGMGTWRLVTHSYYAAVELLAAVEMIESAVEAGMRVPARMFLTQRERRALVDGKPTVKKFPVVALDLNLSVAALGSGSGGAGGAGVLPLPESTPAALPRSWQPVDQQALAPAPPTEVRAVLAENQRPVKPRANAAPPIRSTGVQPRTEAEAVAATPNCTICGQPYGQSKLIKNPEPGGSRFVHVHCLPEEGALPADQPPPVEESVRGGGGAAGSDRASLGTQPAPATGPPHDPKGSGYVRMMSPAQHRKTMALCAEIWPAEPDATSGETDDIRRENLLALCAVLGQPGLTSRTQITASTAPILLDAMEELKAGTLVLTDAGLVDTETGEVKVAAP